MGNIRHTFTSPLRHDHTCHLLYSTYSKYEEDWSSYPHTHYFTELFFVLSGSGSFLVEDETFPIAKHDLIVINPNITHTEKSSLEDPLEYIVLGVDGLNFVIDDANEYLLFHSDEMKDRLDFYFRTILEETENSQKDYEKVCQNLLNILVVHLSRYASSSVEIFRSIRWNPANAAGQSVILILLSGKILHWINLQRLHRSTSIIFLILSQKPMGSLR